MGQKQINSFPLTTVATDTDVVHINQSGIDRQITGANLKNYTDQTGSEIKSLYEGEANAFTDAQFTKLGGIETAATADQSDAEIEAAYNNQVGVVSQVDAEAGTSTTVERWTPQRVGQAVSALGTAIGKNILINAAFRINQREYVSATNTTGADEYTLDRWRVVTLGQNITFSALGTDNTITCPAGGLEQEVEALNVQGGTYVISWTGTATCTVNAVARTSGESFTLTANTSATVKFSSGTIKEVQLEKGSVATNFEYRPIGEELALCQRYYEIGLVTSVSYASSGVYLQRENIQYAVTKRDVPSVSVTLSAGSATGGSADGADASGFRLGFSATGPSQEWIGSYTADAEL